MAAILGDAVGSNKTVRGAAGPGQLWTKQVKTPLDWCLAFIKQEKGAMTRLYSLDAYLHRGPNIITTTDACLWAIGGCLIIDGAIREFFHQAIPEADAKILNIAVGKAEAQQGMESFGLLVALRLWRRFWYNRRVVLTVRSDSVAGLTVVLKFRSTGQAPSLVARELAIDMARTTYTPQIVEHVPGVANVIADLLSRYDVPRAMMCRIIGTA